MGQKRSREETMDPSEEPSPFVSMFETFRKELDEHHDRRERVIKRSRDITAASKKIIFGLQRSRTIGEGLPSHVQKSTKPHEEIIATNFAEVSKDLQGLNGWRYARNISGGCQEYIEAATFSHYLDHGKLLTYEESRRDLTSLCQRQDETSSDQTAPGVELSAEDYVLGLFDMTGELMRFGITAMATSGDLPAVTEHPSLDSSTTAGGRTVLSDLRALRSGLERLEVGYGSPFARDVDKKMDVMKTSVEKVERALYGLIVRGAERPRGWMPDLEGAGAGRKAVDVES